MRKILFIVLLIKSSVTNAQYPRIKQLHRNLNKPINSVVQKYKDKGFVEDTNFNDYVAKGCYQYSFMKQINSDTFYISLLADEKGIIYQIGYSFYDSLLKPKMDAQVELMGYRFSNYSKGMELYWKPSTNRLLAVVDPFIAKRNRRRIYTYYVNSVIRKRG
jgi:hypothetical protein